MAKVTGTLDLSKGREIEFISRQKGVFTIELFCADLSGDTTWTLQYSVSGTNFDTAQDNGTDISETLSNDTAFVRSYECDTALIWKIVFAGETTGSVSYAINVN